MTRATYVMRNGRLVDKRRAAPLSVAGSAPSVISDHMPAMIHPSTGKLMDSKSQFRRVTRANGCVEVGNDVRAPRKPVDMPPVREDIHRAIQELGSR